MRTKARARGKITHFPFFLWLRPYCRPFERLQPAMLGTRASGVRRLAAALGERQLAAAKVGSLIATDHSPLIYSYLSATTGSTFVARRAGM